MENEILNEKKPATHIFLAFILGAVITGAIVFSVMSNQIASVKEQLSVQMPEEQDDEEVLSDPEEYETYLQATVYGIVTEVTRDPVTGQLANGLLRIDVLTDTGEMTTRNTQVVASPYLKFEGLSEEDVVIGSKIMISNAHVLQTGQAIVILAEKITSL